MHKFLSTINSGMDDLECNAWHYGWNFEFLAAGGGVFCDRWLDWNYWKSRKIGHCICYHSTWCMLNYCIPSTGLSCFGSFGYLGCHAVILTCSPPPGRLIIDALFAAAMYLVPSRMRIIQTLYFLQPKKISIWTVLEKLKRPVVVAGGLFAHGCLTAPVGASIFGEKSRLGRLVRTWLPDSTCGRKYFWGKESLRENQQNGIPTKIFIYY